MPLRRPAKTLLVASLCIAALGVAGLGAQAKLQPTSLAVAGTESAHAGALVHRYFGKAESFVILLKGPPRALMAQGQALQRALSREPTISSTLSPWNGGGKALRPTPRSALIYASFRVSPREAIEETVPRLDHLLSTRVSLPVRAVQSGYATVSRAIQDEAAKATRRGELIAIPLLLVVLLLVFRSVVAAAIPLAFGAATVAASQGILAIAANWFSIDAFALTASAMMGLALGVDYTLLMVSRFREELATGRSGAGAAVATRRTAGRTIAFAGGALFLSMSASAVILPGTLLASLAVAVVIVTVTSVALGLLVVPALLALIGRRVDRWSIGGGRSGRATWAGQLDVLLRKPGVVAAALAVLLLLLASPTMALSLGSPTPDQLPSGNRVRLDAELVRREIGPGWAAPYVVLAATKSGPITSRSKLAAIRSWERQIGDEGDVQAVIGPGAIAARLQSLGHLGRSLLGSNGNGTPAARLLSLASRLRRASDGVAVLRQGVGRAGAGASLLADGSGNVVAGARGIAAGLARASSSSGRANAAVVRLAAGTVRLRRGQHRASYGALALTYAIRDLASLLRHSTLAQSRRLQVELGSAESAFPRLEGQAQEVARNVETGLLELQRAGASEDPHYAAALKALEAAQAGIGDGSPSGVPGPRGDLETELASLAAVFAQAGKGAGNVAEGSADRLAELREALSASEKLQHGLQRLAGGGRSLEAGAHRLAQASKAIARGLPRLAGGENALALGAARLGEGSDALAVKLDRAYLRSHPLGPGLRRAASQSKRGGFSLGHESDLLRRLSPGMFGSGYFDLAALDGTPPQVRSRVGHAVNLERGGQAAQILVVPRYKRSGGLDRRLIAAAHRLGRRIGGVAGVAGNLAEQKDYVDVSGSKLPVVVAVVSLLTFLSLVLILRSILVPAVAVILNLLSVTVAFGVLALVAGLPQGAPIGHWAYIDTIGAVAIFAIAFGVSIDYSVFILVRIREEVLAGRSHNDAVRAGVGKTGRIVTGAALMMVAVFGAFAGSNLAIVSQLGTGLMVAILLDATVIRLVLLPALLLLLGRWSWWLPAPLGRLFATFRLA